MSLVKACMDAQVILICLPPHTSHALQPLDVGVFKPMKDQWRLILKRWYRESKHKAVTNTVFPTLIKKLWDAAKPEWAMKGFSGAGIIPPDSSKPLKKAADAAMEAEETNEERQVLTPRTKERSILRQTIMETLAPVASDETLAAIENSKGEFHFQMVNK